MTTPHLRLVERQPVAHPRYDGGDPSLPSSEPGSGFRMLRGDVMWDLGRLDHEALARLSWVIAAELERAGLP